MKNLYLTLVISFSALLLMTSCASNQKTYNMVPLDPFKMGVKNANLLLDDSIENIADELTNLELWSTIISTDSLLEVVYKPANFKGNVLEDDEISYDINASEFQAAKNFIITSVQNNNDKSTPKSIVAFEDDESPIFVIKVDSYKSVSSLRNSPYVQLIAMVGLMEDRESEDHDVLKNSRNKLFLEGMNSIFNRLPDER